MDTQGSVGVVELGHELAVGGRAAASSSPRSRAMPDTLISVPSEAALLRAAMTRWRRRAESAWRPLVIAPVRGLAGQAGWSFAVAGRVLMRGTPFGRGKRRAEGGHAKADRAAGAAMAADDRDGVVHDGPFGVGELGDIAFDLADQPPDAGDFFRGRGRVRASPLIDSLDGGGQAFAGARQVVEIAGEVGQVGDAGAEMVTATPGPGSWPGRGSGAWTRRSSITTAAQDTVTQLVAAIRKVARVVPGAAAVIGPMCSLDYAKAGKPDIDWDDLQARQDLVSDLVNDALAVLAELAGADAPEREAAAADALGLLVLRAAVPGGFTLDDFAIDEHAGTVMGASPGATSETPSQRQAHAIPNRHTTIDTTQ